MDGKWMDWLMVDIGRSASEIGRRPDGQTRGEVGRHGSTGGGVEPVTTAAGFHS